MIDIIKSGAKKAMAAFSVRKYPEITSHKCGENQYRVITRNGLGTEMVFEADSEAEMRKIADESFNRLFR